MSTSFVQAIVALWAAAMVAGCTTSDTYLGAQVADNFGEATKQTFAAQVIDPDPEYAYLVPTTSGDHAVDAIDRYRNDAVKQPETQAVSSVVGSGN